MRILGNNNQNIWPCPHCYEKTRHIRISMSEGLSSDPKVSQTLNSRRFRRLTGNRSGLRIYDELLLLEMPELWNYYASES